MLERPDGVGAHRLFECEHHAGANRPDDVGSAAFLTPLDVIDVTVVGRVDEGDRASAGDRRHPGGEQLPAGHQHPRRPWSADQLVGVDEDGVLVGVRGGRVLGAHRDGYVGSGGGHVPERECAVAVEHRRHGRSVGGDAGDVGRRRERSDLERPGGVRCQSHLESFHVDVAVGGLGDHHDVGDRLPPWQFVRVVLERPDEDHRALVGGDVVAEAESLVQALGDAEAEDSNHQIDRPGGAAAGKDDDVFVGGADAPANDLPGVFAKARRLAAGAR